jgi:hypothetical protein
MLKFSYLIYINRTKYELVADLIAISKHISPN